MKLLLLLFFLLIGAIQAADPVIRPAGFPYGSGTRPTNGPTPGTTTRVPGTINRTGYSDNPSMWTMFIGGAPQSVQDTNELYSINPKSRLEFMTATVKDIGYGTNVPVTYMLLHGLDNTNWVEISRMSNNVVIPGGGPINIYTSDGYLRGNRKMFGNGFDLTLGDTISLGILTLNSSDLRVKLPGNLLTNITGYVLTAVSTNGDAVWAQMSGGGTNVFIGENIYNSNGTLTGDRTLTGNSKGLYLNGLSDFNFLLDDSLSGFYADSATVGISAGTGKSLQIDIHDDATAGKQYPGMSIMAVNSNGNVGWIASSFKGIATGTPGTWMVANTNLYPRYDIPVQPENTVAYVIFPSNSSGSDTIALGDSGTALPILNKSGVAISPNDIISGEYIMLVRSGTGVSAHWTCESCGSGTAVNIYNSDGTLTGDRTVTGGGKILLINDTSTISLQGTNVSALASSILALSGTTAVNINSGISVSITVGAITNNWVFSTTPYDGQTNWPIVVRNPVSGEIAWNSTTIEDILSGGGAGGTNQNFANYDLTATGNRFHNFNGLSLSITNINGLSITGTGGQTFEDTGTITIKAGSPQIQVTPSKIELKAIGSNGINLFSDAISTSNATVNQVWTLQNVTTGQGEWANAAAPAGANVTTVDTVDELLAESTPLVITQGYYAVGDGGHAAYRYVSGDATATNTVTVFEGSAGRYFLMQSGSISAKQAGAVGDGSTDDHDALQALFDACPNMAARIEPFTYYVVGGLTIPDSVRVIASGATLNVDTTGTDRAIDMLSNTKITGGTINCHRVSGGSSGQDHVAIRIGHFDNGTGYSNIVVKSVTLTTDWDSVNANAMIVTGASRDIVIENVHLPSSSTTRAGIVLHWGFLVDATPASGTVHPFNISIKNVTAGEFTCSTGDGTPFYNAACFNVSVDGVRSKRARYGAIVTCGDYGYKYASYAVKTLGGGHYQNIACERGYNAGLLIIDKDSEGNVWPTTDVYDTCTLIGSNDATGQGGIYLTSAVGTTFRNTIIAGFEYGTVFTDSSKNLNFIGCIFSTNRLGGFVMDNAGSDNVLVQACQFYNNSAGLSGTNAGGIRLLAGKNCRLSNNRIGNIGTEANQEVGVQIVDAFVNATLQDNYVLSVKAAGVNVGYHFGGPNDTGHLYLVTGNQAASGITMLSGPAQIPFQQRGIAQRVFTGTATPTVGTYIQGDMVIFDTATATPFAKICSVAGTPGTWVTAY